MADIYLIRKRFLTPFPLRERSNEDKHFRQRVTRLGAHLMQIKMSKAGPSSKTISIRLPESLLEAVKVLANKRDVPYQSMMKVLLSEKIREELNLKEQSVKGS